MRESLFRAAQKGAVDPSLEEEVGQYQSLSLTKECLEESFYPTKTTSALKSQNGEFSTILWPYPLGTGDAIDRANCADYFCNKNQSYRVLTTDSLDSSVSFTDDEKILLFAPFEYILPKLLVDNKGYLSYLGRKINVMLNELSRGYLWRNNILKLEINSDPATLDLQYNDLLTTFINSSKLTLFKGLQMKHFQKMQRVIDDLNIQSLNFRVVSNEKSLPRQVKAMFESYNHFVVRPFSASQGVGVSFFQKAKSLEIQITKYLKETKQRFSKKYGGRNIFPLTLSPFIEGTKIHDCIADIRIFVFYDPNKRGLRSIPAMIRRAQVPFKHSSQIDYSNALTNLNAPRARNAIHGQRVYPLANDNVLELIGLNRQRLIEACIGTSMIWGQAIKDEFSQAIFSYGSIDFLVSKESRKLIPIEMNGNNVGSHPAVHPIFLSKFGEAAAYAINGRS